MTIEYRTTGSIAILFRNRYTSFANGSCSYGSYTGRKLGSIDIFSKSPTSDVHLCSTDQGGDVSIVRTLQTPDREVVDEV